MPRSCGSGFGYLVALEAGCISGGQTPCGQVFKTVVSIRFRISSIETIKWEHAGY